MPGDRRVSTAVLKRFPSVSDVILSQDEVARLIESALTPTHRTILMTLYGAGARRADPGVSNDRA